jgi:hypothetical protein
VREETTAKELLDEMLASGLLPDDDEGLLWAAAVGATHRFWRNTVVEEWHSEPWGLDDGEMMRTNAATVKLIRSQVSVRGVNWRLVAGLVTADDRRLPNGRTLYEYAGDRLHDLRDEALAAADVLASIQEEVGSRAALQCAAAQIYGSRWHGMAQWTSIVDEFCAAVDDPSHSHWLGEFPEQPRPGDIKTTADLRRLLLAGPDTLSEKAANWCIQAGLTYIRPGS